MHSLHPSSAAPKTTLALVSRVLTAGRILNADVQRSDILGRSRGGRSSASMMISSIGPQPKRVPASMPQQWALGARLPYGDPRLSEGHANPGPPTLPRSRMAVSRPNRRRRRYQLRLAASLRASTLDKCSILNIPTKRRLCLFTMSCVAARILPSLKVVF